MARRLIPLFVCVAAASCAGSADGPGVHEHEPVGAVSSALSPSDPLSLAVTSECTTASVVGLSRQLVEEITCLRPGVLSSIEGAPGFSLGGAVLPALQTPAARALVEAQRARGVTMTINSALRTLPQQYLLYRWYQTGRCNISLAASPGKSNHESALAVDIDDSTGWRTAMTGAGFKWLGASDPVHYDYVGSGSVDMGGLSVQAFQRLWNRNHPEDRIDEDGSYGPATEARLAKSPVGGFARGPECGGAPDGGAPQGGDDAGTTRAPEPLPASPRAAPGDEGGCSVGGGGGGRAEWALFVVLFAIARRAPRRSRG